jgi:hypothetical protein
VKDEHSLTVFENMLKKYLHLMGREVRRKWENKMVENCTSPQIVRVMISKRMGWAGYVACMKDN